MADFVNPIGKIRGKFGNVIAYVGKNGKNYCKSASITRKPSKEPQKRHAVAFGTVAQKKRWLAKAIRLGFPGGNGEPKGFNGFSSANKADVVMVEKIEPEKPFRPRKKAMREFQGTIDFGKLRVAAGPLVSPVASAKIDAESRKVYFTHPGILVESIDCFLDDKIYGVILYEPERFCLVAELGMRGDTIDGSMDFPVEVKPDGLVVYIFATSADGREASDSVCLWKSEA